MRHISHIYNIDDSDAYINLNDVIFISSIFTDYNYDTVQYYFNIKIKGGESIKLMNINKSILFNKKEALLENWKKCK